MAIHPPPISLKIAGKVKAVPLKTTTKEVGKAVSFKMTSISHENRPKNNSKLILF